MTNKKMGRSSPQKNNICAIIVTYHPPKEFPETFEMIASQVGQVVIVDNCSDSRTIPALHRLATRSNVHLILNGSNYGVATALNQGIEWAIANGFSWVMTFDQDSMPINTMTETLIDVYSQFEPKDKLALIGSNYYDGNNHLLIDADRPSDQPWVEKRAVITSGSLLSLSVFLDIGPYRDEFFIDEVDSEYCLRARANGFKVIVTRDPLMHHRLGELSPHRFLLRKVWATNHSALRWYHMVRNYTILVREYLFNEPSWLLESFYALTKRGIKMCCFEADRLSKIKAACVGLFHGITFSHTKPEIVPGRR